ncbi:MAG: class I SAM-dependent methyltransferase [Parvibaculum sp.]|uniref:class I SAM-dependent methyltransferase n=1 Tax=Parvibaculum sp. TaxID=2024848 RepID=UPI0025F79328|nr:class I SAM-dependent methyltransferase [Parvibaculum sp.]MCE9649637.1 class I SAM-dependent methyltransferase [Parvibaculum sp.]
MSVAEIDHSALMDKVYRQQRHIYDLTRRYYLLGRDRMIAGLDIGQDDRVLEVGCGTGRNLVAAARKFPDGDFYGMDISSEMLVSARASATRAGLSGRLNFAQGDATAFDPARAFAQPGFERIFMSYTLSMIPGWRAALDSAISNLEPGGELHIVDFGQQERLPRWFRSLLFKWLAAFHVSPRADLREALTDLARAHSATLAFEPLYRGYAWRAILRLPA